MKLLILMLMMLVTACATVSDEALCAGTLAARDAHAEALLEDGGDRSVITGDYLIRLLDAGCDPAE